LHVDAPVDCDSTTAVVTEIAPENFRIFGEVIAMLRSRGFILYDIDEAGRLTEIPVASPPQKRPISRPCPMAAALRIMESA
jgi:hypothetical protein